MHKTKPKKFIQAPEIMNVRTKDQLERLPHLGELWKRSSKNMQAKSVMRLFHRIYYLTHLAEKCCLSSSHPKIFNKEFCLRQI